VPSRILAAKAAQRVGPGAGAEPLLVLDVAEMEYTICASADTAVAPLKFAADEQVDEGTDLRVATALQEIADAVA
jgi:acetyl/propionyl-CoA carboxylase alpha subunit